MKRRRYTAALAVCLAMACAVVTLASNEITVTAFLKLVHGDLTFSRNVTNYKVDQTGTSFSGGVQEIGATPENLTIGTDVGTAGYVFIRNLGTGTVTCTTSVLLYSGDVALFRAGSTTIGASTAAGTADVEYWMVEE